MELGSAKHRPKRHYVKPLPKKSRDISQYGWRGIYRYFVLIIFFTPEAFLVWRWGLEWGDPVWWILSLGYAYLFVLFCVIARPWSGRHL